MCAVFYVEISLNLLLNTWNSHRLLKSVDCGQYPYYSYLGLLNPKDREAQHLPHGHTANE